MCRKVWISSSRFLYWQIYCRPPMVSWCSPLQHRRMIHIVGFEFREAQLCRNTHTLKERKTHTSSHRLTDLVLIPSGRFVMDSLSQRMWGGIQLMLTQQVPFSPALPLDHTHTCTYICTCPCTFLGWVGHEHTHTHKHTHLQHIPW